MKQFKEFTLKEFKHIFRDKTTMLILFAMPLVIIILFSYAISTEVKNISVGVLEQYLKSINNKGSNTSSFNIDVVNYKLYNPQSKSKYMFVPGVLGMMFLLLNAMMSSIAIVREKERGTMEMLLASPLRPYTIIISKLVP